MKLYILRHEERFNRISCNSELTIKGCHNALKLFKKFANKNIDRIITSSFLRCMETISPIAKSKNLLLNVEYGFSEYLLESYFDKTSSLFPDQELIKDKNIQNFNHEYIPFMNENQFRECIPEDTENMTKRIHDTLKHVINKYSNEDILICSHFGPITAMLNYFNPNIPIDDQMEIHFPMGNFTAIDVSPSSI